MIKELLLRSSFYFKVMEYKDGHITSEVIGAAIEVHNTLGCGFPELLYQRALQYEFDKRNINAIAEADMPVHYKDVVLSTRRVDFLIENRICVELKAVMILEDVHLA